MTDTCRKLRNAVASSWQERTIYAGTHIHRDRKIDTCLCSPFPQRTTNAGLKTWVVNFDAFTQKYNHRRFESQGEFTETVRGPAPR
jgi:hypothetical protein